MNTGRVNRVAAATDQRVAAILVGSAALHLIVLTLLGLDLVARPRPPASLDAPVYLDLEPWPDLAGRQNRIRATVPEERITVRPSASIARPAPLRGTQTLRAEASSVPPEPAAPSSEAGPEAGRAPTPRSPWRGDVCRDLSNFAAWNAADCRDRGPAQRAEAQGSPSAAEPSIGQRRGTASERRREESFARTAAANDAWRAYIRSEGDYPGLRSLFTQH